MPGSSQQWKEAFLSEHKLPAEFLPHAETWFEPLAPVLLSRFFKTPERTNPILLGVNGCQGSGKSTFCAYLSAFLKSEHGMKVLVLSLDDFYLTRAERHHLGASVHPMLATRGVPGTHDIGLLIKTLDELWSRKRTHTVPIPRFDKATDDRHVPDKWDAVEGTVDLVLLEGWCMGARPQTDEELQRPVNELERLEDANCTWRSYVNNAMQQFFLPLYERVDAWIMLAAPSFACVFDWRLEQETKLASAASDEHNAVMDPEMVKRFTQYFERLTVHCLTHLPDSVDYLLRLDEFRNIVSTKPSWHIEP
ncbi:MAG: hypothetical protein AAF699_08250 [Pseudomonadota bacterium]